MLQYKTLWLNSWYSAIRSYLHCFHSSCEINEKNCGLKFRCYAVKVHTPCRYPHNSCIQIADTNAYLHKFEWHWAWKHIFYGDWQAVMHVARCDRITSKRLNTSRVLASCSGRWLVFVGQISTPPIERSMFIVRIVDMCRQYRYATVIIWKKMSIVGLWNCEGSGIDIQYLHGFQPTPE